MTFLRCNVSDNAAPVQGHDGLIQMKYTHDLPAL
jgi:hypothetical protein